MGARAPTSPRERAVAFSKAEQIHEILNEANRLKLQVLIRYSNDGKAIRGHVDAFDERERTFRIAGISQGGDSLLKGYETVKVEFILLSKKLVFVSSVRARVPGKIMLSVPDKLVAIERRNNVRFHVPATHAAFVEFTDRVVDVTRMDSPYVPSFLRIGKNVPSRLRIDDVSLGGVACFTRFAAVAEQLKSDEEGFVVATLYFPNMSPMQVPVSIRWSKKTTAAVPSDRYERLQKIVSRRLRNTMGEEEFQLKETYYRLGLQFAEVSSDVDAALRSFIRVVQTAESV